MPRRTNMEVDMENIMELALSGCSSGTMAGDFSWREWSPATDYGQLSGADEFHGLLNQYSLLYTTELNDLSASASATSTICPGTPLYEPPPQIENSAAVSDYEQGFRLVHLLLAGAEALTGANKSRDLARVILARLKELLAGGGASNMERVAVFFTDALQSIVDGSRQHEESQHHSGEVIEAFQLLQDMSPYFKFGHFTANQAILEAVAGERRVHIVDFQIMEGVQWASLMQALVSRQDGQPPPHVRITAVTRCGSGRRSTTPVLETGRRLAAFASSINLPFSFGHCRLNGDEKFRPESVKLVKGEVIVFNCVLYPPHLQWHSAASVASFLAGAGALMSRVVTVVEETQTYAEEGGSNGGEFLGFFMEELRRYSAIWDSLEAGFPFQEKSRGIVEKKILGTMIAGAVERAYRRQEEPEEKTERWAEWMEMAGFRRAELSFFNLCQARLLLGLFNEGYRVDEEAPNKLVFSWKSCRLLSASVWFAPTCGSPATRSYSV